MSYALNTFLKINIFMKEHFAKNSGWLVKIAMAKLKERTLRSMFRNVVLRFVLGVRKSSTLRLLDIICRHVGKGIRV